MTDPSDGATFGDLIVSALSRRADRDAFIMGDRHVTYHESALAIRRFLKAYSDRGLHQGGGVALLSPSSPECWLAQAAAYLTGASFTGLQLLAGHDEHVAVVADSKASILVVDRALLEKAEKLLTAVPTLEHLVVIDEAGVCDAWDATPISELPPLRSRASSDDIAWLQYTGGTTGQPKGVEQTQSAMAHHTLAALSAWAIPERPIYLAASPITHAALLPLFPMLYRGGTVVLLRKFEPEAWFAAVERHRITWALGIPAMIYALLDAKVSREYDTSSLVTLAYGASPMSPARLVEAHQRFGPVFVQLYGQTENICTSTVLDKEDHDPARPHLFASCGRATAGSVVAILDDEGNPTPVGEVGELCMRGRSVMRGYRGLEEETANTLQGGWLRSGDLARQDNEGYFYIVDRKKDMIISGGFNIYAREVEDVLMAHPAVAHAAAIGVPDAKWGEALKAVVVLREGADLDEEDVRSLVREKKGAMFVPKSIDVVDALPMTNVGKVDKKVLRGRYWQGSDRNVH